MVANSCDRELDVSRSVGLTSMTPPHHQVVRPFLHELGTSGFVFCVLCTLRDSLKSVQHAKDEDFASPPFYAKETG